jgi:hypothetical protein
LPRIQSLSQKSEKRLLPSLRLFVHCHSIQMYQRGSQRTDLREILYLRLSSKICQEIPNLVKAVNKYWAPYMKTEVCFIAADNIKLLSWSETV